jgi:hypothetical protein
VWGPNDKDLIMAGLDAKWVRGESPNIAFRTARGASSAPAGLVFAQPVAAAAESAGFALGIPPVVPVPFISAQQCDETGSYPFYMRPSTRPALSFCGVRSVGAKTAIV